MKVAIFSPFATVAPHFETELELAQRHLDKKDSVDYVACLGELSNCDFNRTHDIKKCEDCRGRRRHGLSLLSCNTRPIAFGIGGSVAVPKFESIDELKSYHIESFDIGYAVLSSLVSFCRDPKPDLDEHRQLIDQLFRSAHQTFFFTQEYINNKSPDRIYVFNGRFAAMRAVLRACEQAEVDCFLHERGCDLDHYDTFENHLPHDIDGVHRKIEQAWESADPAQRESVGSQWFHDRVNRVETNWHSFVKDQEEGTLPDCWNSNKRNVVVFCSSDDEFVAIGDHWQNRLYENQLCAIRQIVESLQVDQSIHVYLRMHPNLAAADNETKHEMAGLEYENLTVIAPTDPCDTYHLMRSCDSVVSFGSSVGIEAVYWGKPSILLGPCLYQHLPGPYQPSDHEKAIELIRDRDLQPQEKLGAQKYGHWFQTHGTRFKYFEAESLFHGKFKGQVVYAKPLKRTLPQLFRARAGRFIRALGAVQTK